MTCTPALVHMRSNLAVACDVLCQVVALFIVLSAVWNAAAGLPSDATRNPAGIPLVGTVPSSLPTFSLPLISERTSVVDVFTVRQGVVVGILLRCHTVNSCLLFLHQTAIGVTLVGFVESIAVAQLYAQKHGYDISAGSELKALGLANMVRPSSQHFGCVMRSPTYIAPSLERLSARSPSWARLGDLLSMTLPEPRRRCLVVLSASACFSLPRTRAAPSLSAISAA